MYAVELQGKTTESGESGSTDEGLESYVIPDSGISDELYLQLDKLSQTRNLSVIIYRDMSSPIFWLYAQEQYETAFIFISGYESEQQGWEQ